MRNITSIDDWCEHLIWAEENFKRLESGLINKETCNRRELEERIDHTISALNKVKEWVQRNRE